ncbi:hypothetical protein Q1695_003145 [Nippostrongylus brasiliensis]|nr:hypothetical protein Q1695_003145 [Nippostrongylus brasiliensis]
MWSSEGREDPTTINMVPHPPIFVVVAGAAVTAGAGLLAGIAGTSFIVEGPSVQRLRTFATGVTSLCLGLIYASGCFRSLFAAIGYLPRLAPVYPSFVCHTSALSQILPSVR